MTDSRVIALVRDGLGADAVARLRALRGRLWRRRALMLAAPIAAIGLAVAALTLLVGRTVAIEPLPYLLAGIGVATLLAWLVASWLRRPTLAQTARRADTELGLHERLGTALELLERGAVEPLDARQLDDARARLAAAPITTAFKPRPPRRILGAGAVALGLVALLTIWPNPQDDLLDQRRAIRDASRSVAERIEEVADEAEATGAETEDPRREELVEELRELARQLREQGDDREATLARIGSVQASLDEMHDPQAAALDAALTQLARATSRAASGDETANPEGNGEQAAADLDALAGEVGELSDQEARERAEAIRSAAEGAAAGQAEIASQLAEAADALERAAQSGSESDRAAAEDALRDAAEAFRGAETDRQLQRDVARAQSELSDGSRQVARAGDPAPGSSGQPGTGTANNPGQPGASGAPGGGSNPGASGQPGQPGASGQPGQPGQPGASGAPGGGNQPGGGGNQPGSGGSQPGSGQGVGGGGTTARRIPGGGLRTGGFDGPTQGNKGFEVDGSDGVFTDFDRVGQPGDPDFIAGQGGDGGSEQTGGGSGVGFDNDSVVPYASVFGLFRDFANNQLDNQDVPVTLKDFVRDYFSRLEPTQ